MPEEIETSGEEDEIILEVEGDPFCYMAAEFWVMIFIALLFDLVGLFLFVLSWLGVTIPFTLAISLILDILGTILIGGWALIRFRKLGFKRFLKRFLPVIIAELIPFFGDFVGAWCIFVFWTWKKEVCEAQF